MAVHVSPEKLRSAQDTAPACFSTGCCSYTSSQIVGIPRCAAEHPPSLPPSPYNLMILSTFCLYFRSRLFPHLWLDSYIHLPGPHTLLNVSRTAHNVCISNIKRRLPTKTCPLSPYLSAPLSTQLLQLATQESFLIPSFPFPDLSAYSVISAPKTHPPPVHLCLLAPNPLSADHLPLCPGPLREPRLSVCLAVPRIRSSSRALFPD